MDYSNLSDAQLLALHSGDYSKLSNDELVSLHQAQSADSSPSATAPPEEPSTLGKVGQLAKEFFITGHPNAPGHEPIEPSVGQNLGYAGGVLSTGAIQGAKELAAGTGSMSDFTDALKGNAKGAPQQLEESGFSPLAAYGVGIPLQIATDPLADFSSAPTRAAAGELADKVQTGAENVGDYISNRLAHGAENLAVNHLRPTAAMRAKLGPQGLQSAAREALDSGSIEAGSKASTTAQNLSDRLDEVGAVKGDIVDASDATINPSDIANQVHDQVVSPLLQTSETAPIAENIENKAEGLLKQYPGNSMTPAQLEAEKMAVQSNINYKVDPSAAIQAKESYARVLKQGVENAVTDPNFIPAKQSWQNLNNAQQMAERTANVSHGGLLDTGLGLSAVAHTNPVTLAAAGARALTKGRLSSTGAVLLDKSSKVVQSLTDSNLFTPEQISKIVSSPFSQVLERAGESGGNAGLSTAHYVLQQTDPNYQQLLKDEQE